MARSYAPIFTSIWSDSDFVALSPNAQRVYLLAMSQPNVSYCGVVPFTARRWARMGAGVTEEDIREAVAELEQNGFVAVDDDTEELWVRSFVRHNGVLSQPNVVKAMVREFDSILSETLKARFLDELPDELPAACKPLVEARDKGSGNPSGTPAEGFGEPQACTEGLGREGFTQEPPTLNPRPEPLLSSSTTSSNAPSEPVDDDERLIAEVCRLFADRRLALESNVRSPEAWKSRVRDNALTEHRARILELKRDWVMTPVEMADTLVTGQVRYGKRREVS